MSTNRKHSFFTAKSYGFGGVFIFILKIVNSRMPLSPFHPLHITSNILGWHTQEATTQRSTNENEPTKSNNHIHPKWLSLFIYSYSFTVIPIFLAQAVHTFATS